MKLQPGTPRTLHVPLHPAWVVYDRLPPGCCLDGPPSDSYPSALNLIFTILELPQTSLNVKSHPTTSPSSPVPSDGLVTSIPVMWVVPSCFCDVSVMFPWCVIVFLLYHGFQLLLFVAHATLVYMHFSWADFTPDSGLPNLGSCLESQVLSSCPFKSSLKVSQSALPVPCLA